MALNFNNFFEVNGISLNDEVGIFHGDFDPSSGGGQAAPLASIFIRNTVGSPSFYQKTGNGNTDWTLFSSGLAAHSIDFHSDVDTTTYTPLTGDTLKWDGTNWIPSSQGGLGSGSNNYIFAYDTTTQMFNMADILQDLTFSHNGQIDGWSHTPGSANFTASVGGQYAATIEVNVEKEGGGNVTASLVGQKNGTNITGSHQGMDITSNNTAFSLSRTFLFNCVAGDILKFRIGGQRTEAKVTPSPIIPGIITPISATLIVRKLT